MTKLSKSKALLIIKDYVNTEYISARILSKKYNLAKPCILNILNLRDGYEMKIPKKLEFKLKEKLNRNKSKVGHKLNYDITKTNIGKNFTKLDENIIKSIFNDFATNEINTNELAKKYNCRVGNIDFILKRETWKHVEIDSNILEFVNLKLKPILEKRDMLKSIDIVSLKTNIFNDIETMSRREISKKYNIGYQQVVDILSGNKWKNINIGKQHIKTKTDLTNLEALNIIELYCNGFSKKDLVKKYNVSNAIINNILQRNSFKNLVLSELQINYLNNHHKNDWLTDENILFIFNSYLENDLSFTKLGEKIGFDRKTIASVITRKTYKHVNIDNEILLKIKEKLSR